MDEIKIPQNDKIDIVKILMAIVKKWYLILIVGVLSATIGFCYATYFITPLYRARSTMLIDLRNSVHENITSEQLNIADKYSSTIAYIMKTSAVMEPIVEKLGLKESAAALGSKIKVSVIEESQLLSTSIDYYDRDLALKILKEFDNCAPEFINQKITSGYIIEIEQPTVSSAPVSPNVNRYAMTGFLSGAGLVMLIIAVITILDNKVKSISELQETVELPVLSIIPISQVKGKGV